MFERELKFLIDYFFVDSSKQAKSIIPKLRKIDKKAFVTNIPEEYRQMCTYQYMDRSRHHKIACL